MVARYIRLSSSADVLRASLSVTAVSVLISLLITGLAMYLLVGLDFDSSVPAKDTWLHGIVMAAIVPLFVAPIVTWRLLQTMRELNLARAELSRLARTDPLTGLLNRRGFEEAATSAIVKAREGRAPVAVLVCDIDRFKAINDQLGHEAGDLAIRHIAWTLAEFGQSASAAVGRLGGEEFVLLTRGPGIRQVAALAEALRAACASRPFLVENVKIPITVSIGFAIATHDDATLPSLLARADAAMYRAKTTGRNRVEAAA